MIESAVLVLNRNYQPVHVTSVKRAFSLLYQGVAKAIDAQYRLYEFADWAALSATQDCITTVNRTIRVPRVLVLSRLRVPAQGPGALLPPQHLRARPRHLPVLRASTLPRSELNLDHVNPRCAGRQDDVGERRLLVRALQPEEGRAHAGAGGHEAAA